MASRHVRSAIGAALACVLLGFSACGPKLTDEQLGTRVEDLSQMPGADQPIELPQLASPEETATPDPGETPKPAPDATSEPTPADAPQTPTPNAPTEPAAPQ